MEILGVLLLLKRRSEKQWRRRTTANNERRRQQTTINDNYRRRTRDGFTFERRGGGLILSINRRGKQQTARLCTLSCRLLFSFGRLSGGENKQTARLCTLSSRLLFSFGWPKHPHPPIHLDLGPHGSILFILHFPLYLPTCVVVLASWRRQIRGPEGRE